VDGTGPLLIVVIPEQSIGALSDFAPQGEEIGLGRHFSEALQKRGPRKKIVSDRRRRELTFDP
jgi:hypothetical protein